MRKVVLVSGGMDSAVLLAQQIFEDHDVRVLSVHYGQRHALELEAGDALAKHYGVLRKTVDISSIATQIMQGSSQTDTRVRVPHGKYDDDSMKATVVPNRNMILLAFAGAYAVQEGADAVCYAAHAGDHAIYPDCRPQFAEAMAIALMRCHFTPVMLETPFIRKGKADIVELGKSLHVPFEKTWTCYDPQRVVGGDLIPPGFMHCGRCGTCVERLEAFAIAGIEDPRAYADRTYWQKAVKA